MNLKCYQLVLPNGNPHESQTHYANNSIKAKIFPAIMQSAPTRKFLNPTKLCGPKQQKQIQIRLKLLPKRQLKSSFCQPQKHNTPTPVCVYSLEKTDCLL